MSAYLSTTCTCHDFIRQLWDKPSCHFLGLKFLLIFLPWKAISLVKSLCLPCVIVSKDT